MKNYTLIFLLLIVNPEKYKVDVLTNLINDKNLSIRIKNLSNQPIFFFYGNPINDFKIVDSDNIEPSGKITSIFSVEDYLDYQFDYSDFLIENTMNKYNTTFYETIMYLHYKKNYIIIPANQCKILDLEVLKRNYSTSYQLDSTKSYYLSADIKFSNIYIPNYVKDSLKSKNIELMDVNIKTDKIKIDINKFFRKKNNYYVK